VCVLQESSKPRPAAGTWTLCHLCQESTARQIRLLLPKVSLPSIPCLYTVSQKSSHLRTLCNCQILTNYQIFCAIGKRMKFATKCIRQYPPHLRHCYCTTLGNEKSIFCRCLADMKENANKFWYFRYLKYGVFLHTDSNKIFHVTVLFLCTIVINLWHQKFVTADVIALFVNKQHGIQRRKQDFDKKFVF